MTRTTLTLLCVLATGFLAAAAAISGCSDSDPEPPPVTISTVTVAPSPSPVPATTPPTTPQTAGASRREACQDMLPLLNELRSQGDQAEVDAAAADFIASLPADLPDRDAHVAGIKDAATGKCQ